MLNRNFKIALTILFSIILIVGVVQTFKSFELESRDVSDLSGTPNNGYYKEYYPNGQLKSLQFYHFGMKEGEWVYYYENGQIKEKINYKKDKIHGPRVHFSKDEGVIYRQHFENNKIVQNEVINDSLYKYQVQFLPHGKRLFKSFCTPCHNQNDINNLQTTFFNQVKDTMNFESISIDSLHIQYMNAQTINKDEDNERLIFKIKLFNKYDIEAIRNFLEKEGEKPKKLPKNPVRSLKSYTKSV